MGGSSSKEKRHKSETNSKKSKKAGKVKGKTKNEKKTSAQWARADGEEGDVTFTPGRRKSSGDDIDDQKPMTMRSRSKSLRFGDFTQLDRIHKVTDHDLLPMDIAFFQEGKWNRKSCATCVVCIRVARPCCVGYATRVFHEGCLSKIGQWSGPPDLLATSGMWSCHQCANLGNLLTEEEVIEVLKRLEVCGIRREDDLTQSDYITYCDMSLREDEGKVLTRDKADNARRRFSQVDTANKGRITWCQFLNIETVRILKKRSKNALVRLLTPAELERARDAFRILDTDMDGRITKETAHEALDRNSRRSGYYPDETMMYIDEDLDESISWTEFLRDRAIYILAERPCLRASPLDHSTRRRSSNRSTIADATSLPVTPLTKTPPLPHGKGVVRSMSQAAVKSVLNTPMYKPTSNPHVASNRQSDGASKGYINVQVSAMMMAQANREQVTDSKNGSNRSAPASPTKKQSTGLPPNSASSRERYSHHLQRSASSFPSTPVKNYPPEFPQLQLSQLGSVSHAISNNNSSHAHRDSSGHRGSTHSDGSSGQRLSGGSDNGLGGGGGGGGGPRRLSGHGEQQNASNTPSRREASGGVRRSSQGDSGGGNSSVSGSHHVTGKPPTGNHGRAVAAPPYGKLVERVQKGEYRQTQVRSLHLASQPTHTFGHVTGDTSTGRRPLSLV